MSGATDAPGGVWFVYGWDWNAYPLAVFNDELSARRWADEKGYGEVRFWPFGVEWSDLESVTRNDP